MVKNTASSISVIEDLMNKMKYNSSDAVIVDIFQKFLGNKSCAEWIDHIEAPCKFNHPLACFEDNIVESLHRNMLVIHDVDEGVFKPSWESLIKTLENIRVSSFNWVLRDIVSSNPYTSGLAANLIIQTWLFGKPLYFA